MPERVRALQAHLDTIKEVTQLPIVTSGVPNLIAANIVARNNFV